MRAIVKWVVQEHVETVRRTWFRKREVFCTHTHTFYKARKNTEAEVCTNQQIYVKTQDFG